LQDFLFQEKARVGRGGRGVGDKIKGKKRRTMSSYISTLFLFLKPQQSRGNKITVVAREGGGVSN